MPLKYIHDPRLAGIVSVAESAIVFSIAGFILNLGLAFQSAANNHTPFSFDWTVQSYLLYAAALGAVGKGILAYIGASQSQPQATAAPDGAAPEGK